MGKFLISVLCVSFISVVSGYRILGIFPHLCKSHSYAFDPLMIELSERGHDVTVITNYPIENPLDNYREIIMNTRHNGSDFLTFDDLTCPPGTERFLKHILMPMDLFGMGKITCKDLLKNEEVLAIKEGDFDVILVEQFNSDCGLGIVHKVKAPFIGLASHKLMSWTSDRLGLIDHPSYVPSHYLGHGKTPNFLEAAETFVVNNWYKIIYYFFSQLPERDMMTEVYGEDLPALEAIARNMSLILVNTYFPLTGVVPVAANFVEIGGIHIRHRNKTNPERTDLLNFLDRSNEGVIVFSMGSVLRATSWPAEKLKAFKEAFAELPQTVLWKYENETMERLPRNVKLMTWIPQYDVLQHRNVKAFITHGGMLGLTEAVYSGVPVMTVPIYGDQFSNAASARDSGMGTVLSFDDITKESVVRTLRETLSHKMKARAERMSDIWKHRPQSPLDTAVFWVEHVARYGGEHLRPISADLPLYRYLMIDVLAFLAIVLYSMYIIIGKLFSFIFCDTSKNSTSKLKKVSQKSMKCE